MIGLPKGKTAVLLMELQNDIVHEQGKIASYKTEQFDGAQLVRNIKNRNVIETVRQLITAGRIANVPIIYIRHTYRPDYADAPANLAFIEQYKRMHVLEDGTWGAEFHADLAPHSQDFVISKTRLSAFYATPLEGILTARGLTHLIITGVGTNGGVEGTARDGADRGYFVFIPEDCCGAGTEKAHRASLDGVLAGISTVCLAEDLIEAFNQ